MPEDSDRAGVIAELLDIMTKTAGESEPLVQTAADGFELPQTYNETRVDVVFGNPSWGYVYWDISEADMSFICAARAPLALRVMLFDSVGSPLKADSFALPVSLRDRAQYVLFPAGEKDVRIDLLLETKTPKVLASSPVLHLPHGVPDFKTVALDDIPPLLALSSYKDLLKEQYAKRRESS
ncbi:DUF4912 domain-containing protein [Treponema endosymbiont of Eucomonympha sp.]|uniref:DUF4912 domain-containing protein n=1 Tax=Treponema endosymbiont of Eucomonympha sp. TaxID=1580831 RepID=UPI0007510E17|nr:DUF4912 domain-containing protein [Treponema endosymbiont of Eucomonympha sp.]